MDDHERRVAATAGRFAEAFGGAALAELAGRLHDLGKRDPRWQAYLQDAHRRKEGGGRRRTAPVDHRLAGAFVAFEGNVEPLALLILGHHGGLPSRSIRSKDVETLRRLRRDSPEVRAALEAGLTPSLPPAKTLFPSFALANPRALEMFTRFVFSALVDADHLDTSRHFRGEAEPRAGPALDAERLLASLDAHRRTLRRGSGPVAKVREDVHEACLRAASAGPGVFRLEAPTGSGKTLAAMAFALRHASLHGLRRVVVALPYLSIVEQTVDAYRKALGLGPEDVDVLLEHHNALDVPDDVAERETPPGARAAENWDAPLVVTTTVQLFESLFADGPRRCRKLHNLAGSVVIVDEAQALPPGLMAPILDAMGELARHYRVTFLLTTATQPAVESRGAFQGLSPGSVRDVLPDPRPRFEALRRVAYEVVREPWDWTRAAEAIREAPQGMVVVNTRRQAVALMDALEGTPVFHLSTYLYGEHRREVLRRVRHALDRGEPCRLVATQVVEAGVDLDFPLVLRAMGPLERIVQAAGRCNREGKLDAGRVVVFEPKDGALPRGPYATATEEARILLAAGADLHDPRTYARYFSRLSRSVQPDRNGVQRLREEMDFPAVARAARFIEETPPVVVLREEAARKALEAALPAPSMRARRALQPFVVSLRPDEAERLAARGLVRDEGAGLRTWAGKYDEDVGIGRIAPDPEALLIG